MFKCAYLYVRYFSICSWHPICFHHWFCQPITKEALIPDVDFLVVLFCLPTTNKGLHDLWLWKVKCLCKNYCRRLFSDWNAVFTFSKHKHKQLYCNPHFSFACWLNTHSHIIFKFNRSVYIRKMDGFLKCKLKYLIK